MLRSKIMLCRSLVIALTTSLILLSALPGTTVTNVRAASQTGLTTWSPFGPREQKLTITSYGDFTGMFTAFSAGKVDITDWPLQMVNLQSVGGECDSTVHPDYICTSPTSEFSVFQLDINSHPSLMGVALETNRTLTLPTIVTGTGSPACSTGFGSLMISLENQETGNSVIQDAFNTIAVASQPSGSPSATVSDSGNPNSNGTYQTPCLLAGNYKLTSSIYNATGAGNVPISSGTKTAVTLKVNWFSNSKFTPTAAREAWGKALSHMLDRPSFNAGFWGNTATTDSIMAAPSQGLLAGSGGSPTQAQIDAADCPNLIDAPATTTWLPGCGTTVHLASAYNIVTDFIRAGSEWWQASGAALMMPNGNGYSGQSDLRAACDYLQRMGFAITPSGSTCNDVANAAGGTSAPSSYPHLVPNGNIVYYVRTSAGRKEFGTIIADTLNFLFGTPSSSGGGTVCWGPCPQITPKYFTIFQVTAPVFQDMIHDPNGWAIYTGGYGLNPTPEHLYTFFHSQFTGGICAGPAGASQNYHLHCDPQYDTDSYAAEFSSGGTVTTALFNRVALDAFNTGIDVPVYTPIDRFVELNGWNFQQCNGTLCNATQSSIVNTLGGGTQIGYWTLLNARQVPGYVPSNNAYVPGGGDPNLFRRGFSQDTLYTSPYIASTVWELEIISQIFDSMLQPNPLTGGADGQLIDWQTTSHSSIFTPTETGCNSFNGCFTGVTTQFWHLRNDLKFQDGTPVTASDVAYSIISYRDVPAQGFSTPAQFVISAIGVDCGIGQPCKTLQVKLLGKSPFYELNIGTLPILPKHVWAPICGDPVSTDPLHPSPCANPSFDPMAAGIMIGSGPWTCAVPAGFANAGHVGGSCFVNPDGTLGGQTSQAGGKWFLVRNSLFERCCPDDRSSSLYKLSWADKNNNGVVDILDLADAAVHFGQPDPYWACQGLGNSCPLCPDVCSTVVSIQDLATVAFYFGHGTTYPFLPSQLTGLDPQIDPFFCPTTGC